MHHEVNHFVDMGKLIHRGIWEVLPRKEDDEK